MVSGGINLSCISVRALVRIAYASGTGIVANSLTSRRVDILGGPAWLDTDHYDIAAKPQTSAPVPQIVAPLLQSVLEERFKVKVHNESRDTAVY
jgi:uncharacterized protein (TIGR03435 family)